MNILIVDDEKLARSRLTAIVTKIPGCRVVGYAENGVDAVYKTCNLDIDIILMDIRLPKMSGLEAARHINAAEYPPTIIFITSFQEHSLEAFATYPAGYLLKPVHPNILRNAISHVQRTKFRKVAESMTDTRYEEYYITTLDKGNINLIALNKVCYLMSLEKHTRIYHDNQYSYTSKPLKEFEAEYGERLLRIHRGILINKSYLRGLKKDARTGNYRVCLHGVRKNLLVSRRNLPTVRHFAKTFMQPTKAIKRREQQGRSKKSSSNKK